MKKGSANWVTCSRTLGRAYLELADPRQKPQNLESAITHLSNALAAFSKQNNPSDLGMSAIPCFFIYLLFACIFFVVGVIHSDLGSAMFSRTVGEQSSNIEASIIHHTKALEIFKEEGFVEQAFAVILLIY